MAPMTGDQVIEFQEVETGDRIILPEKCLIKFRPPEKLDFRSPEKCHFRSPEIRSHDHTRSNFRRQLDVGVKTRNILL